MRLAQYPVDFSSVGAASPVVQVRHCFANSGQSCNAPSRMLVEASIYDKAVAIAAEVGASVRVGKPADEGSHLGPHAERAEWEPLKCYARLSVMSERDTDARSTPRGMSCSCSCLGRPVVWRCGGQLVGDESPLGVWRRSRARSTRPSCLILVLA